MNSFICSGLKNIPLTFAAWSALPLQPTILVFVRPHLLSPGAKADISPVANRISG